MARLIDADALKEFIDDCGICAICPQRAPRCSYDCDFPDIVTEKWNIAIDAQPTIDAVSEWIPCSERLPRARESVLLAVNHKYGDWVGEGCYWETTDNHTIWKGYRWNATYWDDEIIAWMPLPKPWKGADDE